MHSEIRLDYVTDDSCRLTSQEIAIIQAIADGLQSKEIAVVLKRSKPTIEAAVRLLYAKMHARSRAHLVARAIAAGIIDARKAAQ